MLCYTIPCLLLAVSPVIFSSQIVPERGSDVSGILYKLLASDIDPEIKRKLLLVDYLGKLSAQHETEEDTEPFSELPKRSHMWFRHSSGNIPIQTRLSFGQPLSRNGIGSIHKIRYGRK
ncbi:Hypothetical predicted protein [Mytilus galloprovincialis]|uniref:Uncharacterized protein n=2 Tax=Mytilus galloprovincialis TaxID=29158 RepID=A0A8B6DPT7_MYTGA|nr:Hypothetical predicted protein [Mytilus galloprovincialis]